MFNTALGGLSLKKICAMFGETSSKGTRLLDLEAVPIPPGSVTIRAERRFTEREFYHFCTKNPKIQAELDQHGNLLVMPPVHPDSGAHEFEATGQLYNWHKHFAQGRAFSPSTAFKLPDGSVRSGDGAWVGPERMAQYVPGEDEEFSVLVPDLVIEIRPATDRLTKARQKMTETWIKNGVRLAWLIDPQHQQAYIYRADGSEEVVTSFDGVLSGEAVCPGLALELRFFKSNP